MKSIICGAGDVGYSIADKLSKKLLENNYSPCIQITGPVESQYIWDGKIKSIEEYNKKIKITLTISGNSKLVGKIIISDIFLSIPNKTFHKHVFLHLDLKFQYLFFLPLRDTI